MVIHDNRDRHGENFKPEVSWTLEGEATLLLKEDPPSPATTGVVTAIVAIVAAITSDTMPAKHTQTKIDTQKKVWGNYSGRRHCSSTHNNEDSTFFKSAYPKEQKSYRKQNKTNPRRAKSYRNKTKQKIREGQSHTEFFLKKYPRKFADDIRAERRDLLLRLHGIVCCDRSFAGNGNISSERSAGTLCFGASASRQRLQPHPCGRQHQSGTLSGGFGGSLIGCNPQIRIRPQKKSARPFVKAGLPRRTDPFHKKGLPSSEFRPS